jgi:hypothetical protein
MARVWYRAVSALLIRRKRPTGGSGGSGRLSAALRDVGLRLEDAREALVDPEASLAAIGAIDLGDRFDAVVLGSHLVNVPDPERRASLLELAARHLAPGGALLVEHHPVDWAETAAATDGATDGVGMIEVVRHPPYVSAVSVYTVDGRVVRQPFTARVLSDAELAAALAAHGLLVRRRLGPTWLEAARPTIEA